MRKMNLFHGLTEKALQWLKSIAISGISKGNRQLFNLINIKYFFNILNSFDLLRLFIYKRRSNTNEILQRLWFG